MLPEWNDLFQEKVEGMNDLQRQADISLTGDDSDCRLLSFGVE